MAISTMRPSKFEDIIGQEEVIQRLRICVSGCNISGGVMPHVLIDGPPGLGKTTIASAIANELNTNLYTVVMGFFVLVICHLQYLARDAYGSVASLPLRLLVQLLGYIFPNFQVFNLADQIGIGEGIDTAVFLRVAGYALIYIAVIGALAVYSFRNREI